MLSIAILHLQDLFCPSIFPLCFTPHLPNATRTTYRRVIQLL